MQIPYTYDLAIAKIAMQIQATEKPDNTRFDNIFIHIGSFHIMLSYFKAIGKFVTDCGLMDIAVESQLIASGSVNGFHTGKHFNRCKCLHPMVALGLEIMFFEGFAEKNPEYNDLAVRDILLSLSEAPAVLTDTLSNPNLAKLMNGYLKYKEETLSGKYGKLPNFI